MFRRALRFSLSVILHAKHSDRSGPLLVQMCRRIGMWHRKLFLQVCLKNRYTVSQKYDRLTSAVDVRRNLIDSHGTLSAQHLHVVSIKNDCDHDTLLIRVHPEGPVCHTGTDTCWGEKNEANPLTFLSELQDFIETRHKEMPEGSYTTSLFKDGINRMAQKVGEEALEAVIEAVNGTDERLIYEGSDMLYHLIVLLTSKGLRIEQMAAELQVRHKPGWKKH